MKRSDVTYGQLDNVLRSRGFTCRILTDEPPARVYEHQLTSARFTLPAFPESEKVLEHHLLGVRTSLDLFGIASPTEFAATMKKAG